MDFQVEETLSNDSCVHLNSVVDTLKGNYQLVIAYYVTCIAKDATKRKAADVYCCICGASNRRIHACLECAFFGCFDLCEYAKEKGGNSHTHMKDHAIENDHYFAININHGCLFCFECDDYVYNKIFEDIYNDYMVEARRVHGNHQYLAWRPRVEEIALLLKGKIKKISDDSYFGLRGIINIGESCYVNSILQVLMHNPLLRDFFLSDKHKCFKKKPDSCLMCEMFILFQEFYSGITLPFNPMNFFKELQKFSINGLGEDQQDAFELFLEILTGLERSCQETHETDNCNCMIHQTFYGVNQISRKCSHCEVASLLPLDHFVDILLDLKGDKDSIVEILKRKFSEPELISDYTCLNCERNETTYKYTTIKKLPAVICFRMNCVNYDSCKSKPVKKKSTPFKFEDSIDMSEFLNSKGDIKLSNGSHASKSCAVVNRYYLFGVISQRGKACGGHFAAYVKQRKNRWFECDDIEVFPKSWEDVVKSEPYLLFYYKQM
ncbi:unnamed protein product [Larinioides sclopetarius]|uniref:Ubiquitinyl hydrolase 1 n=1 Tax=Larinioides sclopetarius TaxID=280406 RepID=A0AAV1ZTC9_9ARAC